MRIWNSDEPKPQSFVESLHVYNGLDCCVTLEVVGAILPQLNEVTGRVYDFERALQSPILEMECRGILVDNAARSSVAASIGEQHDLLCRSLAEILTGGFDVPCSYELQTKGPHRGKLYWTGFNPNSPDQLKVFFYETLGLSAIRSQGKVTCDRKALEKLRSYFHCECVVNHILAIRDCKKKLGVLRTGIDADGRMRTSYNIAGTDTGRLSSYASALGSGTNLQNITGELRSVFIADPGKKLAYVDLQQGESYAVGGILWNLFEDGRYLDACESGDLHTRVCRMCWPELDWTDDAVHNKKVAKQLFYRHFDYRDIAKRLGHGTNYFGKPPHMAKVLNMPVDIVQGFQQAYLKAFGHNRWHEWVRAKLIRDGWLTTFMGRHRFFFGRRFDEETLRAAIAYEPQSAVADYINKGMLAVQAAGIEILLQIHDALLIQYPEDKEAETVALTQKLLAIKIPLMHGRTMIIPTDAQVGWNWAKASEKNPDGLKDFNGVDDRKRSKTVRFLDRVL